MESSVVSGVLVSTLGSGILVSMVGSIVGAVVTTVGAVVDAVVGIVVGAVVTGFFLFAWQPQADREKVRISAITIEKSFFMKLASKIKITLVVCPKMQSLIMRKFLFGRFAHFLTFYYIMKIIVAILRNALYNITEIVILSKGDSLL